VFFDRYRRDYSIFIGGRVVTDEARKGISLTEFIGSAVFDVKVVGE
jgi:hypothetical protein